MRGEAGEVVGLLFMRQAYCGKGRLATLAYLLDPPRLLCFNGHMRFRALILLLLALFFTDVVMAAPAGLTMQLASQGTVGDMPCHLQDHEVGGAHAGSHHEGKLLQDKCHHCMACVVMMGAPSSLVLAPPPLHPEIPFFSQDYPPRAVSPTLRPPILA